MRKETYSQEVLDFIENEFSGHLGYLHCNRVFKITDWRKGEVIVYAINEIPDDESKEFYQHFIPKFKK